MNFSKKRTSWNKGLKGFNTNEKNGKWMGEKAKYGSKHTWISRKKGKPKQCEQCKIISNKCQWANKDHKYKRIIEDYISLCPKCHRKYDFDKGLRNHMALSNKLNKKVYSININTGKKLIYKSIKDATLYNKILRTSISNCLHRRSRTAGGFYWKFI